MSFWGSSVGCGLKARWLANIEWVVVSLVDIEPSLGLSGTITIQMCAFNGP